MPCSLMNHLVSASDLIGAGLGLLMRGRLQGLGSDPGDPRTGKQLRCGGRRGGDAPSARWPGPRRPLGEGRGSASADMGRFPHACSSPVRMAHTFPLSECPPPHLEDRDSDLCSGAELVSWPGEPDPPLAAPGSHHNLGLCGELLGHQWLSAHTAGQRERTAMSPFYRCANQGPSSSITAPSPQHPGTHPGTPAGPSLSPVFFCALWGPIKLNFVASLRAGTR